MSVARAAEPSPGVAWQLFAFLGGMAAYAVHLMGSAALVPLACGIGSTWPLHLLSAVTLVVIAGSFAVARRVWRGASPGRDPVGGVTAHRRRFLGLGGMMLGALAFAVVVFAEVSNHVLDPCLP